MSSTPPSPSKELPLPLLGQLGAAAPKEDAAPAPAAGEKRGPGRPRKDTTNASSGAAGAAGADAGASSGTGPKRGPGRPPNQPKLVERIEAPLVGLGSTLALTGTLRGWDAVAADGASIVGAAEPIALALDRVCAENPKIRKQIEKWLTASAWTELVIALGMLGVDIANNHGWLPGGEVAPAPVGVSAPHAPAA